MESDQHEQDHDERVQVIKWVIESVPVGRVATYGQIAEEAGLPRRARFVAKVLRDLDPTEKVPWHRIIRSDGRIAPRAGACEQAKRLREEGVAVIHGRISLKHYGWLIP